MLFLLVACGRDGVVEEPVYSGDWELPTRVMVEQVDLPRTEDGYVLASGPFGEMFADPEDRSPSSAAGECAALLMACMAPERNVLGCLQNVPVCESEEPWTGTDAFCCHASCEDRYVELRLEGRIEADALATAVFGPEACSPGVDDALAAEKNR